jgi:hypothetical protein
LGTQLKMLLVPAILGVGSHAYLHLTEIVSGPLRQNCVYRLSTSGEFAINTCAHMGPSAAYHCFIKRVHDTEHADATNQKMGSSVPGFSLTFSLHKVGNNIQLLQIYRTSRCSDSLVISYYME